MSHRDEEVKDAGSVWAHLSPKGKCAQACGFPHSVASAGQGLESSRRCVGRDQDPGVLPGLRSSPQVPDCPSCPRLGCSGFFLTRETTNGTVAEEGVLMAPQDPQGLGGLSTYGD